MKEKDRKCSKCGCSAQDPDVTLHRFPMPGRTNSFKCESWAKYCFPNDSWSSPKFQNSLYSRHLMLCTKHFSRTSYMDDFGKRLLKCAVPEEPNSIEQSATSRQPSSNSEDCLMNDVADIVTSPSLLCICCLQTHSPYINLDTCTHADYLDNFEKPAMELNKQVICYQCHGMLKKIKLFKQQVENSFKLISDSVENISQDTQQKLSLTKSQIFKIDIPSTWRRRNRRIKNRGTTQTKRPKPKTTIDKIEGVPKINTVPQTIVEPSKPNIENNLLKKNKNIEDALKILSVNQNSGCINLLASSLQTISCSLLGNIYRTNIQLGNQIHAPTDFLFSVNTPITTNTALNCNANISTVPNNTNFEIGSQNSAPTNIFPNINTPTTINIAPKSSANVITVPNNTNFEIGSQNSAPTNIFPNINTPRVINIAPNSNANVITVPNNTNFEIGSQNSAPTNIFPSINTPTAINIAPISNANVITVPNNTNFEIGSQNSAPTNIFPNMNTPTTINTAHNSSANIITENNNTKSEIGSEITAPPDISPNINTFSITKSTYNSSANISTVLNDTNSEINNQISTPTDIVENTKEIKNTKLEIANQNLPTDILFNILNNTSTNRTATSTSSHITMEYNNTNFEIGNHTISNDFKFSIDTTANKHVAGVPNETITISNATENNGKDEINKMQCEESDIVESVAQEEMLPLTKDEFNDDQSKMRKKETAKNKPSPGSIIRQMTLKREQLMEERSKIASSQVFLRLPHRCESCLIGFQFQENLEDHVKRKHTQDRMRNPQQCDVCLQFVESDNFEKHSFLHYTRYECAACAQQFVTYEKAASHYKNQHQLHKQKTVLKCTHCPFKTEHMFRLKRHIRRVTRCKACGVGITHGCGTGMTFNRHVARCKGPKS
ncbi:hypothetical protein PYW08_012252 [Mythimna loreyi]|uniref:Uncharacterized protein n=1 Tax=Mythimna loreyi TaxID=667449 RepID=A0ACC2Q0X1_9NEOP|nr:hypothetical protein PYW08_012252 [Mythimna loreyi]